MRGPGQPPGAAPVRAARQRRAAARAPPMSDVARALQLRAGAAGARKHSSPCHRPCWVTFDATSRAQQGRSDHAPAEIRSRTVADPARLARPAAATAAARPQMRGTSILEKQEQLVAKYPNCALATPYGVTVRQTTARQHSSPPVLAKGPAPARQRASTPTRAPPQRRPLSTAARCSRDPSCSACTPTPC